MQKILKDLDFLQNKNRKGNRIVAFIPVSEALTLVVT